MWPGSDSEDEFRLFPGANSDEEEEMEREESERMRSDWTKLIIWLSDIDPEAVHKFVDMKETIGIYPSLPSDASRAMANTSKNSRGKRSVLDQSRRT
jgi:hypothetical protein